MCNNSDKLQKFADEVSYPMIDEHMFVDLSHPKNIEIANNWFKKLTFLDRMDLQDLREIWTKACEDGRDAKLLYNAIKTLQGKYGSPNNTRTYKNDEDEDSTE